jgi:hypothetical protein
MKSSNFFNGSDFQLENKHEANGHIAHLSHIAMNIVTVKTPKKSNQRAVRWSQIHGRIELCMKEIILHSKMNF